MAEAYSVVIPAYNAADTIADALSSILTQSISPAEIIVVDDGSTDATASIVKTFGSPVILLSQHNQGCGAATNAGMYRVVSPLIAFLDADDVWLPGKADTQLLRLEKSSEISGLCTRAQTFKGSISEPVLGSAFDLWSRTTMIIRAEAARQIGPMADPPGGRGDTVDWIARGRDLSLRFEMLPDVLALRRIRPGSLSYGRDPEKDRGYLFAVKRALDRKRSMRLGQKGRQDEE